jgi:histidinol phosphatase-like PHP family hydrolase
MKLREWLPEDAELSESDRVFKYLDVEVVSEHDNHHPFKHKYVYSWCLLENNIAVGWNENPSIGWTFPIKRFK